MKLLIKLFISAMLVLYIQLYSQQDPNVNRIISSVNGDSLAMIVKELSGEVQTTIKGTPATILSRYAYEPGNISAADYIEQKLTSYGYTAIKQDNGSTCRNVYAALTGLTEPQNKYIICAHYDSQINVGLKSPSPGADDNASGVAVVLEAARIFKKYLPKYTIVFAFFDEEEIDLIGSKYYISQEGGNILGVINMDMVAYDSNNDYKVDVHLRNVANSSMLSNAVIEVNNLYSIGSNPYVRNPGTADADQYAFWDKGYSAVALIEDELDFSTEYHKSTDRFNMFNANYFLKCAKLGIGVLAYLSLPLIDGGTSVNAKIETINFRLDQNYPNPFNPTTTINYSIPKQNFVTIKVYDVLGREVETLLNKYENAGTHEIEFDGNGLSSGLYFYKITCGNYSETKKMILLR